MEIPLNNEIYRKIPVNFDIYRIDKIWTKNSLRKMKINLLVFLYNIIEKVVSPVSGIYPGKTGTQGTDEDSGLNIGKGRRYFKGESASERFIVLMPRV